MTWQQSTEEENCSLSISETRRNPSRAFASKPCGKIFDNDFNFYTEIITSRFKKLLALTLATHVEVEIEEKSFRETRVFLCCSTYSFSDPSYLFISLDTS
jgi:hypothetical protein